MRTRILARLAAVAVAAASVAVALPSAADPIVQGGEHCVINVRSDDVLNLRRAASPSSAALTGLRYGQCGVMVTGSCRGDWCPVEGGHHAGWAHRHYLGAVSPARFCVVGVAGNDVLNLRAWPSPRSRVLTGLAPSSCGIIALPMLGTGGERSGLAAGKAG